MADAFALDPQLDADTIPLGRLALSRVLLMNDMRFPGSSSCRNAPARRDHRPRRRGSRAADGGDRQGLACAEARLRPDKLNVAALGNRVRQLHVHVIARFVSDAAWPNPVFGSGPAQPYPPHMQGVVADRLAGAMGLAGL